MGPIFWSILCGECIDASPKGIDPCQRRLAWTEISQYSDVQVMVYLLILSGIRQDGLYGSMIMYWIAWYSVSRRCIGPPFAGACFGYIFGLGSGPFGGMKVATTSSRDLVLVVFVTSTLPWRCVNNWTLLQAFYHRITLEEGGCTAESLCSFYN